MYVQCNTEACSWNCCCHGKAVLHILCVCSLSYPACKVHALWPVWLHHIFPHYLINSTTLEKKVTEHKMHVLIFSATYETFPILRTIQQDIIINVRMSSYKVPVTLFVLQWNLNFLNWFSKNNQISNFKNIRPVETKLFHANGQT